MDIVVTQSNLQSIKINLKVLRLGTIEGSLAYEPFSVELTDSLPFCCVRGPSGSGKTTFFKSLIPRFVEDWRNYDTIDLDLAITRNHLDFFSTGGRIGYAAQKPFFIAHRTVRDNLTAPFGWSGSSNPSEAAINEVVHDFALTSIVHRKAFQLSAGERQRLNLARTFIASPELVIIDECFSSMDESLADEIAEIVVKKYSQNSRILITGHRTQDLKRFMPATLRFSFHDKSKPKPVREVIVSYDAGS